jgi:hypothetical protein
MENRVKSMLCYTSRYPINYCEYYTSDLSKGFFTWKYENFCEYRERHSSRHHFFSSQIQKYRHISCKPRAFKQLSAISGKFNAKIFMLTHTPKCSYFCKHMHSLINRDKLLLDIAADGFWCSSRSVGPNCNDIFTIKVDHINFLTFEKVLNISCTKSQHTYSAHQFSQPTTWYEIMEKLIHGIAAISVRKVNRKILLSER